MLDETEHTTDVENVKKLGAIIVRGDNVVIISPPQGDNKWEKPVKEPHPWDDAPTKPSTSNADAAADAHTA